MITEHFSAAHRIVPRKISAVGHVIQRFFLPMGIAAIIHASVLFWPRESGPGPALKARLERSVDLPRMIALDWAFSETTASSDAAAEELSAADGVASEALPSPDFLNALRASELGFACASEIRTRLAEFAGNTAKISPGPPSLSLAESIKSGASGYLPPGGSHGNAVVAPSPPYPVAARNEGREGVVELSVHITADGRASAAMVTVSSGHDDLDRAARDTVLARWKFSTGNPSTQTVRVNFELTTSPHARPRSTLSATLR